MALDLHELDDTTRQFMLREFEVETAGDHYRSAVLSPSGEQAWIQLMRDAITSGDDVTLARALLNPPGLLTTHDTRGFVVNQQQAAVRLATTEFLTWYVRGLSARLLEEKVEHVEVYRAGEPAGPKSSCTAHEGLIVTVAEVYAGHRAKYWPVPDRSAFSVPFHPNCHHAIRRTATPEVD